MQNKPDSYTINNLTIWIDTNTTPLMPYPYVLNAQMNERIKRSMYVSGEVGEALIDGMKQKNPLQIISVLKDKGFTAREIAKSIGKEANLPALCEELKKPSSEHRGFHPATSYSVNRRRY